MTVVVAVKVFDGVALAADSAATVPLIPQLGPATPAQVYNKADKLFHLHRDLPIGLATWGGGFIGTGSMSALAKDLRRRFMGLDLDFPEWKLDDRTYTVQVVADLVIDFFYEEHFSKTQEGLQPPTGLLLVGYSASARQAEVLQIALQSPAERPAPMPVFEQMEYGWQVWGMPAAVSRLIEGIGPGLRRSVNQLLTEEQRPQFDRMLEMIGGPVVIPPMPLADAVDFARFCADVTVGFSRFSPGPDTVGGEIDIAAVSRHEGFRWVQRKHYYPESLNPRRPHEHDREVGRSAVDNETTPSARASQQPNGDDGMGE